MQGTGLGGEGAPKRALRVPGATLAADHLL